MPEGPECRHITDVLRENCLGKTINNTQILSGRYLRHGDPIGYSLLTESSLKIIEIVCNVVGDEENNSYLSKAKHVYKPNNPQKEIVGLPTFTKSLNGSLSLNG